MRTENWLQAINRPPWRTVLPAVFLLLILLGGHALWAPGSDITDGRHDLGRNGIWLQHGWLGDDRWFNENHRTDRLPLFRDPAKIHALALALRQRHITDVFPHLCPTRLTGEIMPVDDAQTERFLQEFQGFHVLPWVGGIMDSDITPDIPKRRQAFVDSIASLLQKHPQLAGIHLNVEPWPSGNRSMILLLQEIRNIMPKDKTLSVAAYPPPTRWHRFSTVHWEEAYFKEVAGHVDQMAVMMYDTSLWDGKLYQALMRSWTREILDWTSAMGSQKPPAILLGVPTYDDAGVGYHDPKVESLTNALLGIHSSLNGYPSLPASYQGVAIYCEWKTSESDWRYWQQHFVNSSDSH